MRMKEVAEWITNDLGIYLNISRLSHYEDRGIIPTPVLDDKKIRNYSMNEIENLKVAVIFSELGIPLRDVKEFIEKPTTLLIEQISGRVRGVEGLVDKAKELIERRKKNVAAISKRNGNNK